jgi:hypothetical protein
MTKRAQAINGFMDTLSDLVLDSMAIRMAIKGGSTTLTVAQGEEVLKGYQRGLKAHLANIVENNDEQAEALMKELGVCWNEHPYKK